MSSSKDELMECRLCQQKGHSIKDCPGLHDPEKSARGLDSGYRHRDAEKLSQLKRQNSQDIARPSHQMVFSEESKHYR